MSLSRRQFAYLGLTGIGGLLAQPYASAEPSPAPDRLNILILGGTGYLGPHLVSRALERGHKLTLFNRGKKAPSEFDGVKTILGDRFGDLSGLKGQTWDVVVDTSAFIPALVENSTALLAAKVGHYVFLSSMAVYQHFSRPELTLESGSLDESAPVFRADSPEWSQLSSFAKYGGSKYSCEEIVADALPGRSLSIRSDTIVGPGDHKHFRYTYWVRRATHQSSILGPGDPGDWVQYVDVRDLAHWIVHCAERQISGVYNATSSPAQYQFQDMIRDCQEVAATAEDVLWVDSDFLLDHGVTEIPFWEPRRQKNSGIGRFSNAAARENGFTERPKKVTALDTYKWFTELSAEQQNFASALTGEVEQDVLKQWVVNLQGARADN